MARSDLIAADRLKHLSRRSDALGVARLALHAGALGASGLAIHAVLGTPWIVPTLMVHGVVVIFLFAPLHETIHRTAFRTRLLNDAVAWIAGLVLVLPPYYFRLFHFAHHRFTQDPSRDPELAVPKPDRPGRLLLHVSGLPYWRERIVTTVRHARGRIEEGFVPARDRRVVALEARALLACYAAVAFGAWAVESWAPLTYWIAPALLGQPALRLFLLAEHAGCPQVSDMLANTRTTVSHALVRGLTWNMPFHAEHHLFPGVPFHALPAVHREVRDRLCVLAPGYVAVHRELWARIWRTPATAG
ncbi:MAG: fatty acid desaturase [Alphaproteobacteria bacterium]